MRQATRRPCLVQLRHRQEIQGQRTRNAGALVNTCVCEKDFTKVMLLESKVPVDSQHTGETAAAQTTKHFKQFDSHPIFLSNAKPGVTQASLLF